MLDPKLDHYKKISSNFRPRSFLTLEEQQYFISEKVRLLLKEECKGCKRILFPKDLLKGSIKEEEKENNGSSPHFVFMCSCRNQIYPNLKVRIGDLSIYKTEDTLFINPIQLRNFLEERMQLDESYRNAE